MHIKSAKWHPLHSFLIPPHHKIMAIHHIKIWIYREKNVISSKKLTLYEETIFISIVRSGFYQFLCVFDRRLKIPLCWRHNKNKPPAPGGRSGKTDNPQRVSIFLCTETVGNSVCCTHAWRRERTPDNQHRWAWLHHICGNPHRTYQSNARQCPVMVCLCRQPGIHPL